MNKFKLIYDFFRLWIKWRDWREAWEDAKFINDKKIQKELEEESVMIKDIEYLQRNLFKSLKIPLHLHGLKEDDVVGVKSLEIKKQNKDE
jgi:hypothetical protein